MKALQRNPLASFFLVFLMALAMALQGCATKPVSPMDYVKTAEAQVGGIYRSIGDLKAQRQITAEEGRKYFARNEVLEKQVDAAKMAIGTGNEVTAQTLIATTLAALTKLSAELNGRK